MSVEANQYGGGSSDPAEHRELPDASVASVGQPNPIRSGRWYARTPLASGGHDAFAAPTPGYS
jgi:hypothetical protein